MFGESSIKTLIEQFDSMNRYWVHKRTGKVISDGATPHLYILHKLGIGINKISRANVATVDITNKNTFVVAYKKGWVRAGFNFNAKNFMFEYPSRLSRQDVINLAGDILVYEKIGSSQSTWNVYLDSGSGGADIGRMSRLSTKSIAYTIVL